MNIDLLHTEFKFRFSRASGKGGQHVNKVSTRVELLLDLVASQSFTAEEKERLRERLAGRINQEGILCVASEQSRSQRSNREEAVRRLIRLLEHALAPEKPRSGPKVRRMSPKLRLRLKKEHSQKKAMRRKGDYLSLQA